MRQSACNCMTAIMTHHRDHFIATGVAIMFFEVFGMGTTVLLQCYIADEEMFKDDALKFMERMVLSLQNDATEETEEGPGDSPRQRYRKCRRRYCHQHHKQS